MGYSSNNNDTGALYFGSVNPTVTGQEVDNDSFMVTSDGTSTGTPISFWKFDEETLTWVQVPSGNSCPAPMTRGALIALRNANGLSKDCDYVITDHVQGRLVTGTTIHLQAVDASTLSENVQVKTTYDNEAWRGIYSIDNGLVLELQDNRNNIARGINGTEVTNFDWGNVAYTNVVVDNATLTVTIGNPALITRVTVDKSAIVTLTGFFGVLNDMTFSTGVTANFTNANGTWRLSTIKGGGGFNVSGYTGGGDHYYNEVDGACNINFSNSVSGVTFRQNDISAQSAITHAGVSTGTFILTSSKVMGSFITHAVGAGNFSASGSHILSSANIAHNTGTMTLTNVRNYSSTISQGTNAGAIMTLNQVYAKQGANITNQAAGTLAMTQTTVEITSTVQRIAGSTGTLTINQSTVSKSSVISHNGTNTGYSTISFCNIEANAQIVNSSAVILTGTRLFLKNATINAIGGSGGSMTLSDTEIFNGSISKLAASTTGVLAVNAGTRIESTSFIQTSGTGNLTVAQSNLSGSSGVNVISGDRNYSFLRLIQTGVSRANLSGTGAGIGDSHEEFEMHYRGVYTNSCSGVANTIRYSECTGLTGVLTLTGTTGGCTINRMKIYDGRFTKNNNPSNGSYQFITLRDNGAINVTAHGVGDSVQYVDIRGNSTLNINKTTATGISQIDIAQGATLNVNGTSGSVNSVMVEQGVITINAGSLNNVSKKMQGLFTINGGAQSNVHHWSNTNKTTAVSNTSRADYLGLVSTAPIL